MVALRESETRDPGWSIEEALKAVISGGVISPAEIKKVAEDKGRGQLDAMPGKQALLERARLITVDFRKQGG